MVSARRRRRAARKVEVGDGRPLQRFRFWQTFTRSLFHVRLRETGEEHTWTVDLRHGGDSDGEVRAHLYREGSHVARSKLPAVFEVPGGVIEVATSGFGLKRCHFVAEDGRERQLTPDRASGEGLRARLAQRSPVLSRCIGLISFLVLLAALVLGVPQLVEQITAIPPVADRVGAFVSPVRLPSPVNVALVVATLLASTERALRLRYHWLLDGGLFDGDD